MIKAVKLMIILAAAFLLFVVVSDYISDYKKQYENELTSMLRPKRSRQFLRRTALSSLRRHLLPDFRNLNIEEDFRQESSN